MLRNIIDLCILAAIFYFGVLVFREQAAIVPLDNDIQRISAILGEFPIADPKKAYIKALPCERPFEYMWRVYLPAGKGLSRKICYDLGGSTSGPITPQPNHSRDYVMKVRLGFDSEYGSLQISEGKEFSSGFTTTSTTLAKVALRNSRIERQQKTAKVNRLKTSVGEMVIKDRNQYGLAADMVAQLRRPATPEWQIYLPSGATYEVCWNGELNEEALSEKRLPTATQRVLLQPGYHILRLFALKGETKWRVVLAVDAKDHAICELDDTVEREEITMKDSIVRNQKVDMNTGQDYLPYQQAIDQPLEVFRGVVAEGKGGEAASGVMAIWIEAKTKK